MKRVGLLLLSLLMLMGCAPTAVPEVAISPTMAVKDTAVPTATPGPTSTPLARTTPIRLAPTPTPPATVTAVFTQITPNPNEPPCPRPDDLAEKEVDVSGEPFCIVWIDPFADETGFQVILEYFQGDQPTERFVYEVAPNITELIVPDADTPRLGESVEQCMRRHSWGIRIVALRQQIEWPFAGMGMNVECGSFDSTPLPTATASP